MEETQRCSGTRLTCGEKLLVEPGPHDTEIDAPLCYMIPSISSKKNTSQKHFPAPSQTPSESRFTKTPLYTTYSPSAL